MRALCFVTRPAAPSRAPVQWITAGQAGVRVYTVETDFDAGALEELRLILGKSLGNDFEGHITAIPLPQHRQVLVYRSLGDERSPRTPAGRTRIAPAGWPRRH